MKKYLRNNKGITLVALVVTIIVLLILAGVTISMAISGDNLFVRARNSVDAYSAAASAEDAAISSGYGTQMNTYEDRFTYQDATKVTTNNYGWKVTDYVAKGAESITWRVFWQDGSYVYIIADSSVENFQYSTYANTAKTNITTNLNPNWNNSWDNQDNGKSVARLTNKANWTKYLDNENKAEWAIGAATLEMYIKSYNESHTGAGLTYSADSAGYVTPSTYTLSQSDNHGIYKGERLIASPLHVEVMGSVVTDFLWLLKGDGTISYSQYDSGKAVYPIVAIPKPNFTFTIKDE